MRTLAIGIRLSLCLFLASCGPAAKDIIGELPFKFPTQKTSNPDDYVINGSGPKATPRLTEDHPWLADPAAFEQESAFVIREALGPPSFSRTEGPSTLWRYDTKSLRLIIISQPTKAEGGSKTAVQCLKADNGRTRPLKLCLLGLLKDQAPLTQ